jgi:hypothetical protein
VEVPLKLPLQEIPRNFHRGSSRWKADQEIRRLAGTLKSHCRVQKNPQLIVCLANCFQSTTSHRLLTYLCNLLHIQVFQKCRLRWCTRTRHQTFCLFNTLPNKNNVNYFSNLNWNLLKKEIVKCFKEIKGTCRNGLCKTI